MKTSLAALGAVERRQASLKALARLKASLPWRECRSVLAYLRFGAELDADQAIGAAFDEGRWAFVPRVTDQGLRFQRITGLDEPMEKGPFGIREMTESAVPWDALAAPGPTLALVPGLAFSRDGRRLGRGGGYYDRFITTVRRESAAVGEPAPLFFGYAYDIQVVSYLPTESHDQTLDGLITDRRILTFG